ncbi:hypothetical protein CV102_25000 [Natronococcus pandeyae]|uniref:Uncharacterized protein n=1 Tax=Natronococcus pandeyae TaxID=2055836 RepID=A0A8J8PW26_9EURY|nr:hypothetical protein [Natronococcus pandeyae]TYL35936.1 hypothetical protein CV102_25000 [Natronococcus pandeyae]
MSSRLESPELAAEVRDGEPVAFDDPTTHGYGWSIRSSEGEKRDDATSRHCGDHDGSYESHSY